MDSRLKGGFAINKCHQHPACNLTDRAFPFTQVQVFFRHGDRSPTPLGDSNARLELWASRLQDIPASFPTYEYFPQAQPWGQLTKKGRLFLLDSHCPSFLLMKCCASNTLSLRTCNLKHVVTWKVSGENSTTKSRETEISLNIRDF